MAFLESRNSKASPAGLAFGLVAFAGWFWLPEQHPVGQNMRASAPRQHSGQEHRMTLCWHQGEHNAVNEPQEMGSGKSQLLSGSRMGQHGPAATWRLRDILENTGYGL